MTCDAEIPVEVIKFQRIFEFVLKIINFEVRTGKNAEIFEVRGEIHNF